MDDILTFILIVVLLWFWWDSRGSAEEATQIVRQHCDRMGVIFLNDTVAWRKIRFKRNRQGRVKLQRTYFFEFASDLQQQYQGEIIMLGQQLYKIDMDVYRI